MTMHRFISGSWFTVAVMLLAGSSASAGAQGRRDRIDRSDRSDRSDIDTTFAFDRTGAVTVGNGSATIVVTGWDKPTIHIHARADEGSVRFEASSKQVTIDPTRAHDDVTIEVDVPRGVKVDARTNSGDITIHGTRADVDVQTSSGDIEITDVRNASVGSLSGDVDLSTVAGTATITSNNGDITISRAAGRIDATAVSGDIEIDRSTSSVVRATNTSGDISFSGSIDPQGRYDFTTHSGDLDLEIPKDANAQVSLTTWNGSLDTDFPITLKPGSRDITKHYTFTIGAGSAHITAEAFSGDISIRSRGAP
jgi:DUF4097 and DUF4098 domain-containing protein YvlB